MKLKLLDIFNSKTALETLNKETFSAKISYIIQKNIKLINLEFEDISKTIAELFKKYGEEASEGNYQIKKENINMFVKEKEELFSQEVDINIIQIPLSEFEYKLSPELMAQIDWMFKFDIE